MAFRLHSDAESWNECARENANPTLGVRVDYYDEFFGELLPELTESEIRVRLAILTRTLRFRKFAEAITADEFCTGFKDPYEQNELCRNDVGRPYFAGCGVKKVDTIYKAIKSLEAKDLITVWRAKRSTHANVYMPFSERWVADALIFNGGQVSMQYDCWVVGERVMCEGRLVKITRSENGVLEVCEFDRWENMSGDPFVVDADALQRLSPSDLRRAKESVFE